jgi:hypothetical protein
MSRPATPERVRPPDPRPTAAATIEPVGPRTSAPRAHAVRLYLPLSSFEERLADRRAVLGFAEAALRALDGDGAPSYFDVLSREKLVAIDAASSLTDAPSADAIERMRQALADVGYRVSMRALRECIDGGCTTALMADPAHLDAVPSGWHSATVCGKHGYRSCGGCGSLYVMTSDPAHGPAEAVHCEVCAGVLVEWGASKSWTAELVTRGRPS